MTETAMKRGQDIQDDIFGLKNALSTISRGHLFSIDSNSCSRQAEPFLAQLEIDMRAMATQRILDKVTELESEFNSL